MPDSSQLVISRSTSVCSSGAAAHSAASCSATAVPEALSLAPGHVLPAQLALEQHREREGDAGERGCMDRAAAGHAPQSRPGRKRQR